MAELGALLAGARLALAVLALLLLPGWLAIDLAGPRARGFERLALAVGASIALWPLLLLWTTLAGGAWGPRRFALALGALALALGWRLARRGRWPWPPRAPDAAGWALAGLMAVAVATRVWQAQGLVAAPWVDGYHHTLITQLVMDQGRVPASFAPYLPVPSFYYHFGFHALAAGLAWLGGSGSREAVLWLGQALSVMAVPAAYLLARSLGARRAAAVAAAAVPAGLFWFPAYYLSWGRFTQLAGMVALPAAWVLVAEAGRRARPGRRWPGRHGGLIVLAGALAAGLVLVHYRVAVFYGLGVAVLALAGAWRPGRRRAGLAALALVTLVALCLAGPWLARLLGTGVGTLRAASDTWYSGSPDLDKVPAWLFTIGQNGLWLRLAVLGLVAGMARRRRGAWLAGATLALTLLVATPGLGGRPSSWMLPPFAVAIGAWLPVAVGLGFLADALLAAWARRRAGGGWPALALAAAALVWATADAWLYRSAAPLADPLPDGVALLAAGLALAWAARPAPGAEGRTRAAVPGRAADAAVAGAALALGALGLVTLRDVTNRGLVLLTAADLRAADWVRARTPASARFLVRTGAWQLGTYRGLDGGYWLPLTSGRQTTMPAAFYNYGDKAYGLAVADLAGVAAQGDSLSDRALTDLLDRAGADYVYVGPTGGDRPGAFSVERLKRHPALTPVYEADGVTIFRRRGARAPEGRPRGAGR